MAGARLRKTFKYPSESESDELRDELDEQEQEALINKFRKDNEKKNEQFRLLFMLLPLPCVIPFVLCMFERPSSNSAPTHVLLCLLGITSLLSTAYTARFIPLQGSNSKQDSTKSMPLAVGDSSPVKKYLPYLNSGICLLLFLAAGLLKGTECSGTQPEMFWLWCLMPGVMLVMAILGRRTMNDADIDELEKLKYDYKGA